MGYKIIKGDIIIRIWRSAGQPKSILGKMYIAQNNSSSNIDLLGGWSISVNHCRKASKNEINAFNNGIKHIKDIVSESIDNFSII